ncbi:MAG: PH domain-containing protein [Planctomycetia bacterium]|jgi:membrane protein YdbS with pleckstrin-like domain
MSQDAAPQHDAAGTGLTRPAQLVRDNATLVRVSLSAAANLAGNEAIVWTGRPSERVIRGYWLFAGACLAVVTPMLGYAITRNAGVPAIAVACIALVTPLVWAWWKQAVVRHTSYELTTERLRVTHGILSLDVDDIELYRIKDIHVRQPILQRVCGLGSILVWSTDVTLPRCRIHAQPIATVRELREQIRMLAEEIRDRKVVRNSS